MLTLARTLTVARAVTLSRSLTPSPTPDPNPEQVALPPLEANRAALREEWGVRDPRALLKRLAALGPGERLELPDGTSLAAEDVQVARLSSTTR